MLTELFIFSSRWIIEECKQQKLAEESEQMLRDTRTRLMSQVQQVEIELAQALKRRQVAMADVM